MPALTPGIDTLRTYAPCMHASGAGQTPQSEASRPRRESADAFQSLPLVVHSVLHDVPLRDVTVVDLPNGGVGRTVADVQALMSGGAGKAATWPTRALFAVRRHVGRIFRWDSQESSRRHPSYRDRVDEAVLRRSVARTAGSDKTFEPLYQLDNESLVEARNATVHAFMSVVLMPLEKGYRLYWAVYVKPVSRFTGLYMALIEPFRRFIVYPALLSAVQRRWAERYATQ